jgi:hypothetical protein
MLRRRGRIRQVRISPELDDGDLRRVLAEIRPSHPLHGLGADRTGAADTRAQVTREAAGPASRGRPARARRLDGGRSLLLAWPLPRVVGLVRPSGSGR